MADLKEVIAHQTRFKVRRELEPVLNKLEALSAKRTLTGDEVRDCLDQIDAILPGVPGSESVRRPR